MQKGETTKSITLVQNGLQLPRLVIVAMFESDAFTKFNVPKYNFQTFNLLKGYMTLDDEILPYGLIYQPGENAYVPREFFISRLALGFTNDEVLNGREGYSDGSFFMAFPVEPIASSGAVSSAKRERESGQLSLHLSFRSALDKNITCFVLSLFNESLHITPLGPKWAVF